MSGLTETVLIETRAGWQALEDLFPAGAGGLVHTYNRWGPDTLTFTVDHDPTLDTPPLKAFAPIEVLLGSNKVWTGSILDTPGSGDDATLTVSAQGWQALLDETHYSALYFHDRIADWADSRGWLLTPLNEYVAAPRVDLGEDVKLIWPKEAGTAPGDSIRRWGISFDAGPSASVAEVAFAQTANGDGNGIITVVTSDNPNPSVRPVGASETSEYAANATATRIHSAGNRRYVHIYYVRTAAFAFSSDLTCRLSNLRLAGVSANYMTSGASTLKAENVIADAAGLIPLIDGGLELATTTLNLPTTAWPYEEKTAREAMELVNAFHGYRLDLTPERRLRFRAPAGDPTLTIDVGNRGVKWVDASRNSGRDINNRVIARGRSGSGIPLRAQADYTGTGPLTGRNRTRDVTIDVGFPVDASHLTALAATYLAKRQGAPLKGSLEVSAPDALRNLNTGASIPPALAGRLVGEAILIDNVVDPDTGRLGRVGNVAGVSVSDGVATITIDNERASFEALLARMGVVGGSA